MYIHLLIKFGSKTYMDNFQKGELHCRQLRKYKELEKEESENNDDTKRGDKYEGAFMVYNPKKSSLSINGKTIQGIVGNTTVYRDYDLDKPVFCMYALTNDNLDKFIDKKSDFIINPAMKKFGDTAVCITNPNEFFLRLDKALKEKYNTGYEARYVEYIDFNEDNCKWGVFKKPIEFSYQNEYRILPHLRIENEYININIGDISDITKSVPVSEIDEIDFLDVNGKSLINNTDI